MKDFIRFIAILFISFWVAAIAASAQCPVMPEGYLCISQAAGNKAAQNARELAAKDEKIAVLEDSLKQKDASVEELKAANAKNTADLSDRLHKTETELAMKTGELTKTEAEAVRQAAIIEVLIRYARPKKFGLINF